MSCDLYLCAGEPSGDLHAEKLMHALRMQSPSLTFAGVGGPRMRSQGLNCSFPMEKLQVMGFIDVFLALPRLIRQFYQVADEILRLNPKAVITIDYPGFNLRLARHLKKRGYTGKCIHFICPSVWAWGKKRIPQMAKSLDLLLTILPFENALFADTTLPTQYVGHPLVERLAKTEDLSHSGHLCNSQTIALFPGSRIHEIQRNLPMYLRTCQTLLQEYPHLQVAISVSDEQFKPLIVQLLKAHRWEHAKPCMLIPSNQTYTLMQSAHVAIAKSGTVTLELALHRVPTVVTYAISLLDTFIAKDLLRIRLPYYCLVNIIAKQEIFPELIGPHFTQDALLKHTRLLLQPQTHKTMQEQCMLISDILGMQQTSQQAARAILETLPQHVRYISKEVK